MSNTKPIAPKFKKGFKHTKLGWIPEDWESIKLGDIFKLSSGKGKPSEIGENRDEEYKYPIYGGNGIMAYSKESFSNGDKILIGRVGEYCGITRKIDGAYWITDNAMFTSEFLFKVDIDFLTYKLQFIQLSRLRNKGGQPLISQKPIYSKLVSLPPLPEQQKIAQVLTTWDKAITQTEQLIAKKQEHKKGLMQVLLTGKKRFVEFIKSDKMKETKLGLIPEDWEVVPVREFGNIVTGGTPKTENKDYYTGDFLFVSPADMNGVKYVNQTGKTLSESGFKTGRKINKGSALFVSIGSTIGKTAIAGTDLVTNQQINAIVQNNENSGEYVYYQLSLNSLRFKRIAGNQAVPILNKSTFQSISIFRAPLVEQQKITSVLSLADKEISSLENQLAKLKEQKKGLMQKLLTGEVRVNPMK